MRREIVEAVRESVRPCMDEDACGNRGLTDEDAEAIARAVLRAALAGEPEAGCTVYPATTSDSTGLTFVSPAMVLYPGGTMCWSAWVDSRDGTPEQRAARSTERALAVANALNLSRDLAAGGNDGE